MPPHPAYMTEDELLAAVIDTAHLFDWVVAHFRPAVTGKGWRTPVQADGVGFPDLVLARPPRLLFAELKGQRGRLSIEQAGWLEVLQQVSRATAMFGRTPLVDVHVWTPQLWADGTIEKALR